jgi:hypothetical protein
MRPLQYMLARPQAFTEQYDCIEQQINYRETHGLLRDWRRSSRDRRAASPAACARPGGGASAPAVCLDVRRQVSLALPTAALATSDST